jgi:type I restriction enzyme, S subunit
MHEFDNIFTGQATMYFDNLSADKFEELRLRKDDILICRTNGNPKLMGKSALVAKDTFYIYESHLFKVRVKDEIIKASTVVVYLNSKYGREEINKHSMQGNQSNFSLAKFKELKFPLFSTDFNNVIDKVVYLAFDNLQNSKHLYAEAENILLEELGLNNWQPTFKSNNTKTLKESLLSSGRMDAEYYQRKYDEVEFKITNYKGGFDSVKNLCNIKNQNVQPESDINYHYCPTKILKIGGC